MNYLETLKNITKSKERKVENIVLLVILLVVILIASKYLFKSTDKENKVSNSTSNSENINSSEESSKNQDDLEEKLEDILSQISGISDVSVVITYSKDTKQNAVYNTKEEEKADSKSTEKTVAYNEDGSKKTAIIESTEMPKIEGAIIVAKGASTVDVRSKIATAVSSLTNVPVYKIQVFEKEV